MLWARSKYGMNLCNKIITLSNEVYDFIDNVNDVGEESVTDYLVWQWRKANANFKFLNIEKHTRHYENKTSGADFELELWVLKKNNSFSFVFQAKKLIHDYDGYWRKLNYKKGSTRQLDMLINYSKKHKKLPFYIFYALDDKNTWPLCKGSNIHKTAIFLTDAQTIDDVTVQYKKRKLSKDKILEYTNPFHCLFCCPLLNKTNGLHDFLREYFPRSLDFYFPDQEVPNYVYSILSNEFGDIRRLIDKHELYMFRNIGVLDLRKVE